MKGDVKRKIFSQLGGQFFLTASPAVLDEPDVI
jgi:hypothetical protein